VGVGDRVRIISPLLEQMTPLGMAPKTRDFRIVGVFSSQMYEFDARYVYVSLPTARDFFELDPGQLNGVHLAATDPDRSESAAGEAVAMLQARQPGPRGWEALDWKARNQTLFAALKLERVVAFVVLAFIILVASFAIVSTLTMSVIEKQKEVSILKTMGARDVGVMKVFLVQGTLVGAFGTLVGVVIAMITVVLIERIGVGIPGEVYYIENLPVHVSAGDVVLIVLAALLIVWDFSVFPAIRGSRLEPVEGLRDG
jgi:lipoprotein-releasing system permease protein